MPNHPSPFTTAPNLHSDDWAGQIGKQRDPVTLAGIAGWIYDCNQHGHTIRPYMPPNSATAYCQVLWVNTNPSAPPFTTKARIPLIKIPPPGMWEGYLDADGYQYHAVLTLRTPASDGTLALDLSTPPAGFFNIVKYPTDPEAEQTNPSIQDATHCYVHSSASCATAPAPTPPQIAHRAAVRDLAATWNALDQATRDAWNRLASRKAIGGYAAFIANAFLPNPKTL